MTVRTRTYMGINYEAPQIVVVGSTADLTLSDGSVLDDGQPFN